MTTGRPNQNGSKDTRHSWIRWALAAGILLLLLLLWGWFSTMHRGQLGSETDRGHGTFVDSAMHDSSRVDTADDQDTTVIDTEITNPNRQESQLNRLDRKLDNDTAMRPNDMAGDPDSVTLDTAKTMGDSAEIGMSSACRNDTIAPWVFPDPSGGLHRSQITVSFTASEPCSIFWRIDSSEWRVYRVPVELARSALLEYRAVDTCGNTMETRQEQYEIDIWEASEFCPKDMEYVEVGESRFCIDRFEWPNRQGAMPQSFISVYHAMDSCFSVGKRLCTMDEWVVACSGPYSWEYPYGDRYEPYGCAAEDTSVNRSGKRRECRGYFDVYDMSGNLAEWTSTKSSKNSRYFNVMGGFWESGSDASCKQVRYSYYPENQHNPVGFRCCKDATK